MARLFDPLWPLGIRIGQSSAHRHLLLILATQRLDASVSRTGSGPHHPGSLYRRELSNRFHRASATRRDNHLPSTGTLSMGRTGVVRRWAGFGEHPARRLPVEAAETDLHRHGWSMARR